MLIDLGASADLDIPTIDLIADVAFKLRTRGVTLMCAKVRGAVRDRLERTNVMDVLGPENFHLSLAAGVDAYNQRYAVVPASDAHCSHAVLFAVPGVMRYDRVTFVPDQDAVRGAIMRQMLLIAVLGMWLLWACAAPTSPQSAATATANTVVVYKTPT